MGAGSLRARPIAVVVAGASGVIGSRLLAHLLDRDDVDRVIAVGRRTLPTSHARLDSPVVDFADPATLNAALPADVSVAFCCLGTTMRRAGSKAAFRAVDFDAVVAFAEAARARGARRLVVVSSIGADPGARSFYLRTKGEVEEALGRIGFPRLVIVRPSLLDDEGERAERRDERRPAERLTLALARPLFRLLGRTRRYAPIRASTVARAMVRLGLDEEGEGQRQPGGVREGERKGERKEEGQRPPGGVREGERKEVRVVESEELHALGEVVEAS